MNRITRYAPTLLLLLPQAAFAELVPLSLGSGRGHMTVVSDEYGSWGGISGAYSTYNAGVGRDDFMFAAHLFAYAELSDNGTAASWLGNRLHFPIGADVRTLPLVSDDGGDGKKRVTQFQLNGRRIGDGGPRNPDIFPAFDVLLVQEMTSPAEFSQTYTFTNLLDESVSLRTTMFQDADLRFQGAYNENHGLIRGNSVITQDAGDILMRTNGESNVGVLDGSLVYGTSGPAAYNLNQYLRVNGGIAPADLNTFNFGSDLTSPLAHNNDLDGNLDTDIGSDLSVAQMWTHELSAGASTNLMITTAFVPEPASLMLLLAAAPFVGRRRR